MPWETVAASVWGVGSAFLPAPLTTEGDSLPSLARGGGEWFGLEDNQ